MDSQHLAVAVAISAAAAYVLRSAYRTWFAAGGCQSCGSCSPKTTAETPTVAFVPVEELTIRRR